MKSWMLCLLLLSLAACGTNDSIRTLEVNHAAAGTQVADLRFTATVQAARALTTVDFVETRAALVATQSDFLESTIEATGISPAIVGTQRFIILGSSPTPLPSPSLAPEASEEGGNVPQASPISAEINVNFVTPTTLPSPTPSPDPNAFRIETPYTATGAGNDGCGAGLTSSFTTTSPEIYVIARAYNIEANTVSFEARWTRDGNPVGPVYDFTPDYDADELCIWFFVDPSDFEFTAGFYTVSIDVNGVASSNAVPFSIIEQP